MTETATTFDLESWKRRFTANAEAAELNSLMDSGWSLSVAQACETRALALYRELINALAETNTEAKDFFDRPDLVAIQEAARFVATKEVAQSTTETPSDKVRRPDRDDWAPAKTKEEETQRLLRTNG
jgi:hypothetical protein